jgi:ferritin
MTVLSEEMSRMLNEQVGREMGNHIFYTMFASWFHVKGLKRLSAFFSGEADGETGHAKLIMALLNDANAQIAIPAIEKKQSDFSDCEEIANLYVEAEAQTTMHLKAIWKQSETDFDIGAQDVLQALLKEQHEEEGSAERFSNLVQASNGDYIKLDLALGE